jgi:hypothetical protein
MPPQLEHANRMFAAGGDLAGGELAGGWRVADWLAGGVRELGPAFRELLWVVAWPKRCRDPPAGAGDFDCETAASSWVAALPPVADSDLSVVRNWIVNTASQAWHLPLRPRMSSRPSNSCLHFGHSNIQSVTAASFSAGPCEIVKTCPQRLHWPRLPNSSRAQINTWSHWGQGTRTLLASTWLPLPDGAGALAAAPPGMVSVFAQAGHSQASPPVPSGTRSIFLQYLQANSIGIKRL